MGPEIAVPVRDQHAPVPVCTAMVACWSTNGGRVTCART